VVDPSDLVFSDSEVQVSDRAPAMTKGWWASRSALVFNILLFLLLNVAEPSDICLIRLFPDSEEPSGMPNKTDFDERCSIEDDAAEPEIEASMPPRGGVGDDVDGDVDIGGCAVVTPGI